MKIKKSLPLTVVLVLALLAVFALSCVLLSACGGTKYKITWEPGDNAEIKVTGYDKLPDEADADATLSFTVSAESGYKIVTVKSSVTTTDEEGKATTTTKTIKEKNGTYEITVTGDTKITVTTDKVIKSVVVDKKPTDLTYYAGEKLDTSGMTVNVVYQTGEKAVVTDYTIEPSTFRGKETSFTVNYNNVKSEPVELAKAVEYLITLDPAGGTIDNELLETWKANTEFHDFTVDTTGKLSFSYLNLTESVNLPSVEQMTKADYNFKGWRDGNTSVTSLNNNEAKSLNLVANWEAQLVEVKSVKLEEKTEGDVKVPYLIINGTFKAAEEAYLFLYEGNDNVEMKGTTVTGTRGDNFELKFDLRKLSDPANETSYKGKWMDIRFNASFGDGEKDESMQIYIEKDSDLEVDTSSKITTGDFTYMFTTYTNSGETTLKVYYTDYVYDYTVATSKVGDVDTLTISGTINTKYAGKTVRISWWQSSESPEDYGIIDASGNWTVNVDLADFALNSNAFAHFTVIESEADQTVLYGGTDTNLLVSGCTTELPKLPEKVGDIGNAISYERADGMTCYVGYAWDGLMIYVRNEAYTTAVTAVTLELIDEKPCYVVSGTYTGDLKAGDFGILLEEGGTPYLDKCTVTLDSANGTFRMVADLSEIDAGSPWLWPHITVKETSNSIVDNSMACNGQTITANGKKYDIICGNEDPNNTWKQAILVVTAA